MGFLEIWGVKDPGVLLCAALLGDGADIMY